MSEKSEDFVEYLKSIGRLDDAAVKLAEIVNRVIITSVHVLQSVNIVIIKGKLCIKRGKV